MEIIVNGESQKISDHLSLQGLHDHLCLRNQRVAIEVNQQIIPQSQWPITTLSQGDKIEIIQAIGGG